MRRPCSAADAPPLLIMGEPRVNVYRSKKSSVPVPTSLAAPMASTGSPDHLRHPPFAHSKESPYSKNIYQQRTLEKYIRIEHTSRTPSGRQAMLGGVTLRFIILTTSMPTKPVSPAKKTFMRERSMWNNASTCNSPSFHTVVCFLFPDVNIARHYPSPFVGVETSSDQRQATVRYRMEDVQRISH